MELFEGVNSREEWLVAKADVMNLPIGGTMELLPMCNMDCRMCYIRMTKAEMEYHGRMLSCNEWLSIAQKAKDAGVLFLLLTGGEPLMFPEFKRLYTALTDMGFILTLNTNGTLIDEEMADLFAQRPCRRINITLYGKDDATYGDLCRNPQGFTQVMNAVRLLKAREVPFRFNFTCTPYNLDQLPELYELSRELGVPMAHSVYVFPPTRRDQDCDAIERLSPQRCGEAFLVGAAAKNPQIPLQAMAAPSLAPLREPVHSHAAGYNCRAGRSGFWINWKGELLACGMFNEPKESLLEQDFTAAWKKISAAFRALPVCQDCEHCSKRNLCKVCPAACYTETGSTEGRPEYLCRTTDAMIELILPYLPEAEQAAYRALLEQAE